MADLRSKLLIFLNNCIYNIDIKFGTKKWGDVQEYEFIKCVKNYPYYRYEVLDHIAENIWAIVILKRALIIGKWISKQGYSSYESNSSCNYLQYVPYDCLMWKKWIDDSLKIYKNLNGTISISEYHIKITSDDMVRERLIKIPLNSGYPVLYWMLNKYNIHDFCRVYQCIEDIRSNKNNIYVLKLCFEKHLDIIVESKKGFEMIHEMHNYKKKFSELEIENIYKKYLWRILEKMCLMFKYRRIQQNMV